MRVRVDGACHCRAITFEAEIDPNRVGICHCTDCQTFSSSAFRTSVMVMGDDFRIVEGTPAIYEKEAESGAARCLAFCSRCGTHLYGTTAGDEPSFYSVRVGTLAQCADLAPSVQVWCKSALPWLDTLPEIRKIARQ